MTVKKVILLLSGLSAICILVAVHRSNLPKYAYPLPPAHVDSNKSGLDRKTRHTDLEWFGALPAIAADKEEAPRPFGEVIAALTATRNPADALKAYQMIEGCEALRPVFAIDPMPDAFLPRKKQCATITDVMRRARYDYLRAAAYAGTPGAGSDWFRYGPSGDMEALRSRPNDPSVIEWKRQAMALVVRDGDQGDFNALQDLMHGYAGKDLIFADDPKQELAYALAYKDVVDLLQAGGVLNQPAPAELQALAAKLSPEQVAWAKAKAAAIVAARAKRTKFGDR
jgi:hypothetical protein